MASRTEQIQRANKAKDQTMMAFARALTPWIDRVVSEDRPGPNRVSEEARMELSVILRQQLDAGARRILKFDYREFKQLEDEIDTTIAQEMDRQINAYHAIALGSILATVSEHMNRVNVLRSDPQQSARSVRFSLRNLLRAQRLTIGLSAAEWVTETSRQTVVLAVNDPLRNTIGQIVSLLEVGDRAGARRLSREVIRLARLPLSTSQGQLINTLNVDERLFEPIVQGEAITNLRRQADRLTATEKIWVTVGDSRVRPSHIAANGQRQPIGTPFQLSDGMLQYPGDGSLGASLGTIINCRCATAYT